MKRTPLKPSSKPMKRTPMNKVSKKRRSERPRVDRWEAAVWKRDGNICKNINCKYNRYIGVCRVQLDAHHIWEKGSRPQWRFVLENGITLCRHCHGLLHDCKWDLLSIGIDKDALKEEFNRDVGTIIE